MRVLLDCRTAWWSGVGRYSRGLARALAARDDVRLVQVIARGEQPPVPAGVNGVIVPVEGHPFRPEGARALAAAIEENSPDLTHCLHFPTPRPVRGPLVVTLHDLTPLLVPGVMPSPVRRFAYRQLNRRAARAADRIVCPSEHTAADVRRVLPAGDKVRVVLEAADDFGAGCVAELPERFSEAPYVLSMGNTKPHKDLPTLLRAFAEVAAEREDLRLLLVGADAPGFVASVLGPGPTAARVAFTGPVDDDVLRALYASAAVFAFPSLAEGFGLPPLEAMSLGAPVICARAASLPEVVGDAALVFEPGDHVELGACIRRVLDDPAEADRLRRAGEERAAGFSWARAADETVAVYREALAGR